MGFPQSSISKESTSNECSLQPTACNVGYQVLIPESRRSPREGNGNPLQYPGLESPMDRGAW